MRGDAALEPYFEEVASWERDRVRAAERTVRLVAGCAVLGWLAALAACIALGTLVPLKRIEPYLVRVDNSTGIVDVVPGVTPGVSIPEAVTRYLLTHYIQICERFNFPTAESDYEECAALHAPRMNQRWAARWAVTNPESPLNRYKDGTTVRAEVAAVSFFERGNGVKDLAQVRYVVWTRSAGGESETATHWIATLEYAYTEPSSDPRLRRWNPLGFRIVDFRPEPEVETPAAAAKNTASAKTAGEGAR